MKWSQAREYSVDVFSALRNLVLPCPEPLTFIHLPKCAGTSLRRALARCYRVPTSRRIENVPHNQVIRAALSGPRVNFNLEERLQVWDTAERIGLYAMLSGAPLVMGHLPFNRHRYKAVLHKRKFITVLRDPVERWISNYRNSRRSDSRHPWQEQSLSEFLETEYARHYGSSMVTYLSGSRQIGDISCPEHLCAVAKENLESRNSVLPTSNSTPSHGI